MNLTFAIEYAKHPLINAYIPIGIWGHTTDADNWDADAQFIDGYDDRAEYASNEINHLIEADGIPENWLLCETISIRNYGGIMGPVHVVDIYKDIPDMMNTFLNHAKAMYSKDKTQNN